MITNTKIGATNIMLNNSYKLGTNRNTLLNFLKTRTTQIHSNVCCTTLFNRSYVSGSGCDAIAKTVYGFEPSSWEWTGSSSSSTISVWGLVCGYKYRVRLAQAFFFGDCMIGQFFPLLSFFVNINHCFKILKNNTMVFQTSCSNKCEC